MLRWVGAMPETATSLMRMWKANQAARSKPSDGMMNTGSVDMATARPPTSMTPKSTPWWGPRRTSSRSAPR